MSDFIPKEIPEDEWRQLAPGKSYAVKLGSQDRVFLRLGGGKSFFLAIQPLKSDGHAIFSLHYESGEEHLLHNLVKDAQLILGRSSEAAVKIMHAIISRKHLELRWNQNILMVRDLGSVNGSYCYASCPYFNIDEYLEVRPLEKSKDMTLDEVHQIFGPTLDDFLQLYSDQKKKESENNDPRNSETETNTTN